MAGANPFDKFDRPGPTRERANVNPFDQFTPPEPPKEPERSGWEKAGNFGIDVLRNFNDTLTFGAYSKGVDAMGDAVGVDLQQQELLEQSDRENPWAGVVGDTLGYIPAGLGASAAVAKAVPRLAGNGVRATMGREAIASGAVSATDDLARTGRIDPMGVAIDTGTGGLLAGGFAGAGRLISPEARVRASGNGMTDQDRLMTEYYMRQGEGLGVPLSVPEAASAANPRAAIPIQGLFDDALQTPRGSQVVQGFEANRGPIIEQTGRDMVDAVGPGVRPDVVTQAADQAIERSRDIVQGSAQPYYDAADARKLPPSWVPKGPSIDAATNEVVSNAEKMNFLRMQAGLPKGTPVGTNSILFQDAVQKQLGTMGAKAADSGKDPLLASIRFSAAEDVTNAADRVAPEYATAREITEEGKAAVDILAEGPLGRVAKQPTAKGQASTLFGVDNNVDAAASRRALAFMGAENPDVPSGLLANQLDSAVSSSPSNWANTALPTPQARGLALDIAPADVIPRLEAASRVDPYTGQSLPGYDGSPIAKAFAGITNLGKGNVASILTSGPGPRRSIIPGVVKPGVPQILGKTGPVQRGLTTAATGTATTTRKRRRRNRGED